MRQLGAQAANRRLQPHGGEHVAERLTLWNVHAGAVAGDYGHFQAGGESKRVGGFVEIVAFEEKLQCNPEIRQQLLDFSSDSQLLRKRGAAWNPQRQAVFHGAAEIVQGERVLALRGATPADGDEFGKLAVGGAGRRQQNEVGVCHMELGADDELDARLLGGEIRLHGAGHGTFVGDGDGLVAEGAGGMHQFVWMRSAAQKAVVGDGVQLREGVWDGGVGHQAK